jgi:hypothetical protein
MGKRKRGKQTASPYGRAPSGELVSFMLGSGRNRAGMVNLEYRVGRERLVTSFRLSLICFEHNPRDNDRVLGYDTAHNHRYGPCHRHHKDQAKPVALQDCRFTEVLARFCKEAMALMQQLDCPRPSEEVWKSACE